jgi:hypothetical protein
MRVHRTEKADSAADTMTRREKLSQKAAVSTDPAAPGAADAVGRKVVRKRTTRGVEREDRFSNSGILIFRRLVLFK